MAGEDHRRVGPLIHLNELLFVEDDPLQLVVGHLVVIGHGDGLKWASLNAQVAEHAPAHVDRELLDVELLPVFRVLFAGRFDVDHLRRARPGTGLATDAFELSRLFIDGQNRHSTKSMGGFPAFFGVLQRDRGFKEVFEREPHPLDQSEAAVQDPFDVVADVVPALDHRILLIVDHPEPPLSRRVPRRRRAHPITRVLAGADDCLSENEEDGSEDDAFDAPKQGAGVHRDHREEGVKSDGVADHLGFKERAGARAIP